MSKLSWKQFEKACHFGNFTVPLLQLCSFVFLEGRMKFWIGDIVQMSSTRSVPLAAVAHHTPRSQTCHCFVFSKPQIQLSLACLSAQTSDNWSYTDYACNHSTPEAISILLSILGSQQFWLNERMQYNKHTTRRVQRVVFSICCSTRAKLAGCPSGILSPCPSPWVSSSREDRLKRRVAAHLRIHAEVKAKICRKNTRDCENSSCHFLRQSFSGQSIWIALYLLFSPLDRLQGYV